MTSVNQIYWPDAEMVALAVSYDTVEISLGCVDGVKRRIRCCGHIAVSLAPCWDEVVVSRCRVSPTSTIQQTTLSALSNSAVYQVDSGCTARNQRVFQTLTIVFGDDSELVVVAHEFLVHEES